MWLAPIGPDCPKQPGDWGASIYVRSFSRLTTHVMTQRKLHLFQNEKRCYLTYGWYMTQYLDEGQEVKRQS